MKFKTTLSMVSLVLLLLSGAEGQAQSRNEAPAPFAEKLHVGVIDPAYFDRGLVTISGFKALAQRADKQPIYAAYDHRGSPGLMQLDHSAVGVTRIWGASALGLDDNFSWIGATVDDRRDRLYLCAAAPLLSDENEPQQWEVALLAVPHCMSDPKLVRSVVLPERPSAFAMVPGTASVAMLTAPSNFFVRLPIDEGEPTINRDIFPFIPHQYPAGECLAQGPDGRLFGSFKGRLFRYHPRNGPKEAFFEYLGQVPSVYGHLSQARLSAATFAKGKFIGGTAGGGYLFTTPLKGRPIRPRGKPTGGTSIHSLVTTEHGSVWGLSASPTGITRLFQYKPGAGVIRDRGMLAGHLEPGDRRWLWRAFHGGPMLALGDQRLLIGEQANQAKLVVVNLDSVEGQDK